MSHLGELEQLILFAVTALGGDAYGGAIRAHIEERSGRIVSSGAINTTLGRLAERRLVVGRVGDARTRTRRAPAEVRTH